MAKPPFFSSNTDGRW